jgi:hypothetical protein
MENFEFREKKIQIFLLCSFLQRENKNLTGTARYTSINTHLGIGKCSILESNKNTGHVVFVLKILRSALVYEAPRKNSYELCFAGKVSRFSLRISRVNFSVVVKIYVKHFYCLLFNNK